MNGRCDPRAERGFTLVSAIFILVVLAALAAFVVVVSTTQQVGSALDVQGARAYQAARAGLEWGLYRQLRNNDCVAPRSFTLPAAAASLSGFVVTVSCTPFADANGAPIVYAIEATACNQPVPGWGATSAACPGAAGALGYVERRVRATVNMP